MMKRMIPLFVGAAAVLGLSGVMAFPGVDSAAAQSLGRAPEAAPPSILEIGRSYGVHRSPDNSGRLEWGSVPSDSILLVDHVSVSAVATSPVREDSSLSFAFGVSGVQVEFFLPPTAPYSERFGGLQTFNPPLVFNPGTPIIGTIGGILVDPDRSGVTIQGRLIRAQ
jgi:hypothetical protein